MINPQRGVVEVRNVSQFHGVSGSRTHALDSVSLQIPSGKFVSVVGPSGCGKSTLLMLLVGLIKSSAGELYVNGDRVDGPDPDRVGVVFQDANLFPWLSARKNVEFPLALKGISQEERLRRSYEALALVELGDFADRYPHELSGGMRQRVAIARGIVQDPDVLMMDEPFSALDEQTRIMMGDELLSIWDRTQKTIMFVTHSLTEAVYLSDQVIVMSNRPGRIVDCIDIDLPRPRTFEMTTTRHFMDLRSRIWKHIRSDS